MLKLETLIELQQNSSYEYTRWIISMEAIVHSTKTKAKDFLPDSTSFKDRVIKKFMRTKLTSETLALKLFDVYNNLADYENGEVDSIDTILNNADYYDGY